MATPTPPKPVQPKPEVVLPKGSAPLKPGDKIIGVDNSGVVIISRAPPPDTQPTQEQKDRARANNNAPINPDTGKAQTYNISTGKYQDTPYTNINIAQSGSSFSSRGTNLPSDNPQLVADVKKAQQQQYYNDAIINSQLTGNALLPSQNREYERQIREAKQAGYQNAAIVNSALTGNALLPSDLKTIKSDIEANKKAGFDNAQIVNGLGFGTPQELKSTEQPADLNYTLLEYKPSVAEKYNRVIESASVSPNILIAGAAFAADVGIFATRELAYEIPKAVVTSAARYNIFNINAGKNLFEDASTTFKFITTPNPILGKDILARPGKYVGIVGANIFAPEAYIKGTKAALTVTEGVLDTSRAMLSDKSAAVFRDSRSSRAGERMSPISNVQKSKQARQQYYNPNDIMTGGKYVQRSGRANVDSRIIEQIGNQEARVTVTRKSPRAENRVTSRSITDVNFAQQTIDVRNEVQIGKGSATTRPQGVGQRPPSQQSYNKIDLSNAQLKSNEYILVQKQVGMLKTKTPKRVPNPALSPDFTNPSDTGQILKQEKTFEPVTKYDNSNVFQKRTENPRARVVNEMKARLKKLAQQRLAAKRGAYNEPVTIPENFFDTQSREIAVRQTSEVQTKPQFFGQVEKISPNTKLAPTSDVIDTQIGTRVDISYVASATEPDITIIPPSRAKVYTGVSVLNEPVSGLKAKSAIKTQTSLASASLLNIKQDSTLKTKTQTQNRLLLTPTVITKTAIQPALILESRVATKAKTISQVKTVLDSLSALRSRSVSKLKTQTVQNNVSINIDKKQKDNILIPRGEVPRPTPRKPRDIIPPDQTPRVFVFTPTNESKPKEQKSSGFFNIISRKGGKEIRINAAPIKNVRSAFGIAQNVVGGTARASFKIINTTTGKEVSSPSVSSQFYKNAKTGFYVEKNKFRINTSGEKQQITAKGISASRVFKKKNSYKLFSR